MKQISLVKRKEQKGITLVALVITVIVTLIIAGVGISLITGENGLFTKANHAASEYNSKAQSEATKFSELMNYLNGNYGSGDGGSQGGGAQTVTYTVAYDANEGTGAPESQIKTQGTDLTLSATVPTRSGYKFLGWSEDQNATTATYQASGTYNTEASTTMYAVWLQRMENDMTLAQAKGLADPDEKVTIKAPLNDGGSANQNVVIPPGFVLAADTGEYVNAGIVIKNATDGNEFVWIPVANSTAYTRTAFKGETLATSYTTKKIDDKYYVYESQPTDEASSINIYHGFYFGRYEAGSKEDTVAKTMRTAETAAQTVTVQKDQVPYNNVAINSSKAGSGMGNCTDLAASLGNGYSGNTFTKLCSSYAWDTALNFVGDSNWATGTGRPTIAQNYRNAPSFEYKYFEDSQIKTATSTGTAGAGPNKVIVTGQGTATKNIYDMGGNCFEYTSEANSDTYNSYVLRGGRYKDDSVSIPAGCRLSTGGYANGDYTFRLTLFL